MISKNEKKKPPSADAEKLAQQLHKKTQPKTLRRKKRNLNTKQIKWPQSQIKLKER